MSPTRPVRPLQRGDTIGVVAPSGCIPPAALKAGIELICACGYHVITGEHVLDRAPHCDYLAGQDADRASDFNEMIRRDDVAAIFCARGGYGASRIAGLLDWPALRARPRPLVGYSDITSLHLALAAEVGCVSIHGPMIGALPELDASALEQFWAVLEGTLPACSLPADPASMRVIVPGKAEGELAGGCLTLLASACGTPWQPDLRGKIVLIEDVGEQIYSADRSLTQLLNCGQLQLAAGFVFGDLTDWPALEAKPPCNTVDSLLQDIFVPLGKPMIAGFPFGHVPNPLTLPLGSWARLDASSRTLSLGAAPEGEYASPRLSVTGVSSPYLHTGSPRLFLGHTEDSAVRSRRE